MNHAGRLILSCSMLGFAAAAPAAPPVVTSPAVAP